MIFDSDTNIKKIIFSSTVSFHDFYFFNFESFVLSNYKLLIWFLWNFSYKILSSKNMSRYEEKKELIFPDNILDILEGMILYRKFVQ